MTQTARSFLGAPAVEALGRPILDHARGLPAAAYTADAFLEIERRRLFPRTWVGVAFDDDVANSGDALPFDLDGVPVVLVRDDSGRIRAFHNVCRHRATIVQPCPATRLRQFKCPYHGWTYALDGTLVATPFWDGTPGTERNPVDPEFNSLEPIACDVWNHVVFLNLDGQAGSLRDYLAPMEAELAHLDVSGLELGHRVSWEFDANWKLVMENWEVYHHVWVHTGEFDKMSDEVDLDSGEPYTEMAAEGNVMFLRYKPTRPAPALAPNDITSLPGVPSKWKKSTPTSTANAILPNTTVTIGADAYVPAVYTPVSPGRTRTSMAWYFAPGAAKGPEFAAVREAVLDRWLGSSRRFEDRGGIRAQDHYCMELQQAARASPVANDVKFSTTWESNVRYFQEWLVHRMD